MEVCWKVATSVPPETNVMIADLCPTATLTYVSAERIALKTWMEELAHEEKPPLADLPFCAYARGFCR